MHVFPSLCSCVRELAIGLLDRVFLNQALTGVSYGDGINGSSVAFHLFLWQYMHVVSDVSLSALSIPIFTHELIVYASCYLGEYIKPDRSSLHHQASPDAYSDRFLPLLTHLLGSVL